jgi:hypothetical protein
MRDRQDFLRGVDYVCISVVASRMAASLDL